ncbi:MAG: SPOR domain-containing protein [Alphaproteobacteria bacterium]|nr:SPOR domain-containing protein [Alphaproteobacteria bacterium]
MTDDGRGRSSVNLEELERQLREASRSRIRAAASDPALRGAEPEQAPIPDLAALTRQFGPRQTVATAPAVEPWSNTPSPFSRPEPSFEPPQPQSDQWSDFQNSPMAGGNGQSVPPVYQPQEQSSSVSYSDSAGSPFAQAEARQPPSLSAIPNPIEPPPGGYTGLVGELPRGFAPPVNDRFPELERERKASWSGVRTFIILLIVALGVGGVYLFQSGRFAVTLGPQSDQKQVPVIKPDPTPVKIAPDNKTAETVPAGTELFKKDAPENPANVTKRASPEVPVDINTVVKAAPATKSIVPAMGDPKAVKTVTVRPDGTIVGDPQITPTKPASETAPQVAQPPKNIAAIEPAPLAPKAEPVVTPTPPPSQPAKPSLPPLVGQSSDVPLPLARPNDLDSVVATAGADPLADLVKSATQSPAQSEPVTEPVPVQATGDYAVQFGAPAVEADANGLAKRVRTEFAEQIDGRDVVVIKADSNGKTVYRVRAVGYTRDEANAACGGITTAGGKCFIARN